MFRSFAAARLVATARSSGTTVAANPCGVIRLAQSNGRVLSKIISSSSRRFFRATPNRHAKMTLEQLAAAADLKDQRVLVRVDLNVPLDSNDAVTDDTRLRAVVPTVQFLLEQGAAVILCSHFGRPKGEIIETGKNGRLTPVQKPLAELLGVPVHKVHDCVGPEVEEAAAALQGGKEVLLLENTRFYAGETKNDPVLAAGLGKLADYFVNDAFGTAHRAHSSTAGVTQHVQYAAAGMLMAKELQFLVGAVQEQPQRPLVAIVGGAKVSTKIPVIRSLIDKCDVILLGGGMIFTFYKALGYDIGASLVEEDMVELAASLMKLAAERNVRLVLPTDVVLADAFDNNAVTVTAPCTEITGHWRGLDIGPETLEKSFRREIDAASTVLWNGPMGVFEMPNFATGTFAVAQMLADATAQRGTVTIVGGGDSVAAINQAGLGHAVSHISTGGGASLELLEGKVLPGVAALTDV